MFVKTSDYFLRSCFQKLLGHSIQLMIILQFPSSPPSSILCFRSILEHTFLVEFSCRWSSAWEICLHSWCGCLKFCISGPECPCRPISWFPQTQWGDEVRIHLAGEESLWWILAMCLCFLSSLEQKIKFFLSSG